MDEDDGIMRAMDGWTILIGFRVAKFYYFFPHYLLPANMEVQSPLEAEALSLEEFVALVQLEDAAELADGEKRTKNKENPSPPAQGEKASISISRKACTI